MGPWLRRVGTDRGVDVGRQHRGRLVCSAVLCMRVVEVGTRLGDRGIAEVGLACQFAMARLPRSTVVGQISGHEFGIHVN
jgi:hypothetical protein